MGDRANDCRRAEMLLEPFLDGELGPDDERWLRCHLEECSRCREEVWALRVGRKAQEVLVPSERSELALSECRERVLAQIREPVSPPGRLHPVRSRWWWVAASAAAMVLAVFLARRPTAPIVEPTTTIVEQEAEALPPPEPDWPLVIAQAPAERTVTEARFFWNDVQIIWVFGSDFRP